MQKRYLLLFFFCLIHSVLFSDFYSEGKYSGWYCFEDKEKQKEKEPEDYCDIDDPALADQIIKKKTERLMQFLNLAQLNPTTKNIAQFLKLQAEILDRSFLFSVAGKRFLLEHPELAGSLDNPALSSFGMSVEKKKRNAEKINIVETFKDRFALFLFCNGNDLISNEAATIAKLFASGFGWRIRVFSLSGEPIEAFPDWKKSNQLEEAFRIKQAPAFFMVNPLSWNSVEKTFEAYLVGTGIFSVPELVDNIIAQAEHYKLLGGSPPTTQPPKGGERVAPDQLQPS